MHTGSIPTNPWGFINKMLAAGVQGAMDNGLPPAAMIACACFESGYGTSKIYRITRCPFNLQKPAHFTWVKCEVVPIETGVTTDDQRKVIACKVAPFCKAAGDTEADALADSVRIWSAWVLNWPDIHAREYLLSKRDDPLEFAKRLPWVGFGEFSKRTQNGELFAGIVRTYNLEDQCAAFRTLGY